MNSEAREMMPTSPATGTEERRRGRKPSEAKDKGPLILFFLAEGRPANEQIVLKEKFGSEGAVMVEAFKRGEPYYRVEVWKSHAVVNGGVVAIEKEPVKVQT
jgi:hypothetical protein